MPWDDHGLKNARIPGARQTVQHRTSPTQPSSITDFSANTQQSNDIKSWGPTIQGCHWLNLVKPYAFNATNPSQVHSSPTTLSQKQNSWMIRNPNCTDKFYSSNLAILNCIEKPQPPLTPKKLVLRLHPRHGLLVLLMLPVLLVLPLPNIFLDEMSCWNPTSPCRY